MHHLKSAIFKNLSGSVRTGKPTMSITRVSERRQELKQKPTPNNRGQGIYAIEGAVLAMPAPEQPAQHVLQIEPGSYKMQILLPALRHPLFGVP